jgi:hypothetical protein
MLARRGNGLRISAHNWRKQTYYFAIRLRSQPVAAGADAMAAYGKATSRRLDIGAGKCVKLF